MRRQKRKHEEQRVECYKCREEGHKYKECLLWKRGERVACVTKSQKVHPAKEKA